MTAYLPPGTMTLAAALARYAEVKLADAWRDARPDERAILEGEPPTTGWGRGITLRPDTVAAQSYEAFRPTLAEGRLPAMLRVKAGPPRPIRAASWQAEGADDLGALVAGHVGFVLEDGTTERGAVLIAEDALAALLEGRPVPVAALDRQPASAPHPKQDRGGRPVTYDVAKFLGIAARMIETHDPSTPADLRKLALAAYANTLPRDRFPSDEWAKPHIRKFWSGLYPNGKA